MLLLLLYILQICDHNMQIRVIDPRHGGAWRDSEIWNASFLRKCFEDRFNNGDTSTRLIGIFTAPIIYIFVYHC